MFVEENEVRQPDNAAAASCCTSLHFCSFSNQGPVIPGEKQHGYKENIHIPDGNRGAGNEPRSLLLRCSFDPVLLGGGI